MQSDENEEKSLEGLLAKHDLIPAYVRILNRSRKAGLEQGRKEGIREVVKLALQAINDEPEFPSDMPDELWIELDGNRHNTLLSMRNTVKLTKKGIIERLEARLKEWGVK